MNRLRKHPPPAFDDESSNDDDDDNDPFTAMSSKHSNNSKKKVRTLNQATAMSSTSSIAKIAVTSPSMKTKILDDSTISSDVLETTVVATSEIAGVNSKANMKRHHGAISDTRKARMDALLLELQSAETLKINSSHTSSIGRSSHVDSSNPTHHHQSFPPPGMEKRGSFVDPTEEHETTNIFVGNLAPSITEEEMTELFRQFGKEASQLVDFMIIDVASIFYCPTLFLFYLV
jgi:hypothetical protein